MGWYGYGYDDDDFYEEPPEPAPLAGSIRIAGPVYAVSKRGDIGVEWWGRQWVATLEKVMRDARLDRGKRYARNGSVDDLEIGYGMAFAHISGSRGRRYHTYVRLKPFTDDEWNKALKALSAQAIYSAKLLAGEMPQDIETIFGGVGTSLFPRDRKDIQFDCSCPDWGDPCKHSAALYYLLAEQLDADPFILFHLRGRSRDDVLAQLRIYRGEDAASEGGLIADTPSEVLAPPLDADLSAFWSGQALHFTSPVRYKRPYAFQQLGDPPMGNLNAFLEVYNEIAGAAAEWLGLDDLHDEES